MKKLSERIREQSAEWPTPFVMQERLEGWAKEVEILEGLLRETRIVVGSDPDFSHTDLKARIDAVIPRPSIK